MRKFILCNIGLLCFSIQVYCQLEAKAGGGVQHYTTTKFDCAIFPSDNDGKSNEKVFTPTVDQVNIAEKAMEKQLKDAPTLHPKELMFVRKHLEEYKRQYFGYMDHKNHHILYINCFMGVSTDGSTDWLTEEVTPKGGANYWQATFDLDEGQFTKISFND